MTTDAQAEGTETYAEAFNRGFEAATKLFWGIGPIDDPEAVKKLPAGTLVRDARGRLQFKSSANGWISVAVTRTPTIYLALPVEVLYHG